MKKKHIIIGGFLVLCAVLILNIFSIIRFENLILTNDETPLPVGNIQDFPKDARFLDAQIGSKKIIVEIADTPEARAQGLSQRPYIDDMSGMLFVFDSPEYYRFWMKNMLFPIDIIWINANYTIAAVSESLLPESYPQLYLPPVPIKYVIEVRAGWVKRNKIRINESVSWE